METSISNEIIKVLDALCDKFGIAVDWSSENILPYIATLTDKCINYEVSTSIYWIFLSIILLGFGTYLFFHGKATVAQTDWDKGVGSFLVGSGLLIASLVIIPCQMLDIIKSYTFPELILMDQIQRIINIIS